MRFTRTIARLTVLCALVARAAFGAGLEQRLQSLTNAVDAHLANSAGPAAPPEWRKLLWFHLAGDRRPDALVVLRTRRDECAAAARGPLPCRALILSGQSDGSFRVISEFTLREHPVALAYGEVGVQDLYFAREGGAQPVYGQYRFNGEVFARIDAQKSAEQLSKTPVMLTDDRSMPLLADQVYAARHFSNDEARLAPFRLHYDAVAYAAQRSSNPLIHDEQYGARAGQLLKALEPDAQAWVKALAWPQTLELRLWACVDWMIERRFWEIESSRLGRLGACVEPAIFAARQNLVRGDEAMADLVRVQLLQQVGAAWLLRIAPLTPELRTQIARADAQAVQFRSAAAAAILAHRLRSPGMDRAAVALAVLAQVTDRWFNAYEKAEEFFVEPTPELRAFSQATGQAMRAHQCARRVMGLAPASAFAKVVCDAQSLEVTRAIADQLQKDLQP